MNRTITYTLRIELMDMANSVVYSQNFKIQKYNTPKEKNWRYNTEYYFEDDRENNLRGDILANQTIRINRGGSYAIRAIISKDKNCQKIKKILL